MSDKDYAGKESFTIPSLPFVFLNEILISTIKEQVQLRFGVQKSSLF